MILFSFAISAAIFVVWYIIYGVELAMNGADNNGSYNPIKYLEEDLWNFGTPAGRKAFVLKLKIRDEEWDNYQSDEEYYRMLPAIWYPWVFHGLFFILFTISIVHLMYRILG